MLTIEIPVDAETQRAAAHVIDRLSRIDHTMCGPFFNYDAAYEQIVKGMLAELEASSPVQVTSYDVGTVYLGVYDTPTAELTSGPNELKLKLVLQ